MKKMNNKGFAITTIVYGISIMGIMIVAILMAIMSTTYTNNKELAKEIERELNNFSRTEISFLGLGDGVGNNHYPTPQEYVVPEGEDGWYRIELWGTQGGGDGGYGAYTSGIIKLKEGDTLYFYVGKYQDASSSGRETDVRLQSGDYNDASSLLTRIMVAAGGGSSPGASGGTFNGYTPLMNSFGGYLESVKDGQDFSLALPSPTNVTNGTLVGYSLSYASATASKQLTPGTNICQVATYNTGGGDGYLPSNLSVIGGISFIAGYAGNFAYALDGKVSPHPKVQYQNPTTGVTSDYYFIDGKMLAGVNQGDGRAKIERINLSEEEETSSPKQNAKFKNVRLIRDCNYAIKGSETIKATKISAISAGEDKAYGKTLKDDGLCKEIDLGAQYDLDEIAVWHVDGENLKDHTVATCTRSACSGEQWQYIKKRSNETVYSETETVLGMHFSAYQPDYVEALPKTGTYYIMPVLYENKTLTAQTNVALENTPIKAEYLSGDKQQRWSIEEILGKPKKNPDGTIVTEKEYKIVELSRYKSLSIYEDENRVLNKIVANQNFNSQARNEPQIWRIKSLGNGTYTISTAASPLNGIASGNLVPIPYPVNSDIEEVYQNALVIGKNNSDTQRFKLVSLEYSN